METWEHIYNNNSAKLLGVCRRYVNSNQIAEDVMHDAFEVAMQKIDSYSGKGSFDGWLYQITVNTALQYIRKNKNTVNKSEEVLDFHMKSEFENDLPKNKRSTVHQAEFEVSDLMEAIDLLPEHHRTVFNLYVLEKYSHQEISKELDITVNTSKSHLNRARKKLQEILFNKAKNKEKNNYSKYLFLLFPFYFSIDGLYAQKLKDYTLPPINSIPTSITTNINKVSVTSKSVLLSKKLLIFTSFLIIIGASIFYINSTKKEKTTYIPVTLNKIAPINNDLTLDSTIIEIDYLFDSVHTAKNIEIDTKLEEKEFIEHKKTIKKQKVIKPVTIKVPVIIHKKVIIKDTIEEK